MHLQQLPSRALADQAQHPVLAARPLTEAQLHAEAPDARWTALRHGEAVARASLWWQALPAWPDARLGFIGHYAAADVDAGRALLDHAAGQLAAQGCTLAVGPLDGSTWRAYRLVIERGDEPPFFLEPQNPDDWPEHFHAAGFGEFARYTSAIAELEPQSPAPPTTSSLLAPPALPALPALPATPTLAAAEARLLAAGYRVRALDLDAIDRELSSLYDVSMASFAGNLLYAPITRDEFTRQYSAILPRIDPRLVLLAAHGGETVGYVFALPDVLERARTGTVRTAIVKTLAVRPDHAGLGLGGVLTERCQRVALDLGLTRVIHALMLDTNVSQRISRRYGRTFRRYALFSRPIA